MNYIDEMLDELKDSDRVDVLSEGFLDSQDVPKDYHDIVRTLTRLYEKPMITFSNSHELNESESWYTYKQPQKVSDLLRTGRVDLRDLTITNSASDIAFIAKVFSDPRMEIMRILYVDEKGKILGSDSVTSRLPNVSGIQKYHKSETDNYRSLRRSFNEYEMKMHKLGAVGYYILHNHPSGSAKPSALDIDITKKFIYFIPDFLGHIIVSDSQYSFIDKNLNCTTANIDSVETIDNFLFSDDQGSIAERVNAIKSFLQEHYVNLIYLNSKLVVKSVQVLSTDFVNNQQFGNYINNQKRINGAANCIAVVDDKHLVDKLLPLYKNKVLIDIIYINNAGNALSFAYKDIDISDENLVDDRPNSWLNYKFYEL